MIATTVCALFVFCADLKVYDMKGVRTARFCHNRKDVESTYFPAHDVLYRLKDGAPRHGRVDLSGWGVRDEDMRSVAKVSLGRGSSVADGPFF